MLIDRRSRQDSHVLHSLDFDLVPWSWLGEARGTAVMPVIDGTSLVALVSDYERSRDYDLPGSYCGYDAEYVDNVFRYRQDDFGHYQGRHVELLSCNGCFEAGCWPLEANIVVGPTTVVWRDFRQPHRRDRSYAGFGPFEFDRGGYMSAMSSLKTRLADLADQMVSGRDSEAGSLGP